MLIIYFSPPLVSVVPTRHFPAESYMILNYTVNFSFLNVRQLILSCFHYLTASLCSHRQSN